MDAHTVLVKARNLIADEKNWAQRPIQGGPWCAVGALNEAKAHDLDMFYAAISALGEVVGDPVVFHWNDEPNRTHAEVLAAFDRAIAATAPQPDLSFLKNVRVEPERVA